MKTWVLITALLLAAAEVPPAAAQASGAASNVAAVSAPSATSSPATPVSTASTGTPDKAKATASTPPVSAPATTTRAAATGAKLYAPASQLVNWPMQVMVSPDLPEGASPRLTLLISHGDTPEEVSGCANIPTQFMSRNQTWIGGADTDGVNAQHVGTLLLFDLSSTCKIDALKPMTRVRPILDWSLAGQPCTDCVLIGTSLVNLGSAKAAFIESLVAVTLGVLLIVGIARIGKQHKLIELFYSVDDGKLSLSMLQMAVWTVAAVMMVVFEDLLRLDTPTVPSSIVVLMGMSLLTTGFSYHLTANPPSGNPAVKPLVAPAAGRSRLSDLLSVPDANGVMQLSLSRAQMLLWTLAMVVLFVAKSAINQSLWDIPWPLVALMGVSQAGYLGGKFSQ